jgi:hypothetical protein
LEYHDYSSPVKSATMQNDPMPRLARRLGWSVGVAGAMAVAVTLALGRRKSADDRPSRGPISETEQPGEESSAQVELPSKPIIDRFSARPSSQQSANAQVAQQVRPHAVYDTRTFEQLAQAWAVEKDDAEWSLNMNTFVDAINDTMPDDRDAQRLDAISARCRESVCRIDVQAQDPRSLHYLLESARPQQPHLAYHVQAGDGGVSVEAYVSRELGEPTDPQ